MMQWKGGLRVDDFKRRVLSVVSVRLTAPYTCSDRNRAGSALSNKAVGRLVQSTTFQQESCWRTVPPCNATWQADHSQPPVQR